MNIKSLDDLLILAEKSIKGDDIGEIDFSDFAKISVKIDGENYHGELTASLCHSLNQFHDSLSRLYCIAKYGEENLTNLSEEDKELLNVTFFVNEGCTEWKVDFQELFEKIGTARRNCNSHEGIESSYAIQAGRELRLIVHPDEIDDDKAMILSREVAKEIEEKMQYPGQIKVTVIRETRAIEYAK